MSTQQKHTPEPWRVRQPTLGKIGGIEVVNPDGLIAQMQFHPARQNEALADAERIVACVNACAGMDDPVAEIEGLRSESSARLAVAQQAGDELIAAEAQRDELLAALRDFKKIAATAYIHWGRGEDTEAGKHLLALAGGIPKYDARIDAIHAILAKHGG